jgi:hypothetical protein
MNRSSISVSRHYRFDWQYAVDISRLPYLRTASIIIALTPIAIQLVHALTTEWKVALELPPSVWLLWGASVAFIASWVVLAMRCPQFIKEYRDFGEYLRRAHSHRWIVWEFFSSIKTIKLWQAIVRETEEKGITISPAATQDPQVFAACPIFVDGPDPTQIVVGKPVNLNRDIYLPIQYFGSKRVLVLQEDDPKLQQKEKELYWILYSQAAKERSIARFLFWILISIAVLLVAINVLHNMGKVIVPWISP